MICEICKEPKQVKVNILGETKIVPCLCRCERDKKAKEQEEQEKKENLAQLNKMRALGFHNSIMEKWKFENDDMKNEKVSQIAKKYADNFDEIKKLGKGLLLYGDVGTGKTFIAACIVNKLIEKKVPCLMTNFSRIANTLNGMFEGKQKYIDSLNRFELLVLDDLATERDTEYMNEIVYNVIDARYQAGLPTIITTNLSPDEIKNPVDVKRQRIHSRILEMCIPIEVKGEDRRKENLKNNFSEMMNFLKK